MLVVAACAVCQGTVSAQDAPGGDVQRHIERVAAGLLPAVSLQGEAPARRSLAEQMVALHVPGVSIAVIRHGQIEWARGYGTTRANGGGPVTADTLFQAGSVSKPVAAMAALRMVQDGQLRLDENVNAMLTSWQLPDNAYTRRTPVTLRALLSHTAGAGVHGFAGYAGGAAVPSLVQVLDGAAPSNSAAIRVDAPVGQGYRYSGGGYTVMQQMMVDAARMPFADLLQKTVLQPLGMQRSSFRQPLNPASVSNTAWPYDGAGQAIAGGPHTYPEMAAAGLWTSANDLARFVIELERTWQGKSSRVLSTDSARMMLTPVKGDWGLGLEVGGSGADRYFYHDRANAGYRATLVGYAASGDGAVVLTNGDQGYQLGQEIVRSIAAEYGWADFHPVPRSAVRADPAQKRYAGTFAIDGMGTFDIRAVAGGLVAAIHSGVTEPLLASSNHSFFVTSQDLQIDFDDGSGDRGTLQAGAARLPFQRVGARSR
jgi:CubicO group peptidase (beta-lactamase class C family)